MTRWGLGSIDRSTVIPFDPPVYVQGSFPLGTAIRPLSDEEEYDADSVCALRLLGTGDLTQKALKTLVGDEIKAYRRAQKMVVPHAPPEWGVRHWECSFEYA